MTERSGDDGTPSPAEGHPETASDAAPEAPAGEPRQVMLRRAPRYRAFVLTGVLVGAVAGLVLAVGAPTGGEFSTASLIGYLAVAFGLVGGLIGGLVAVLLDRPRRR